MRVLFILGVLFCCISCKKQEESKVRNKIQEETVSQITKEDISKLNYREFILDAKAEKSLESWQKYYELDNIINNVNQANLAFFKNNNEILIAFIDDFCRSMKQPSTIVIDNAPIHHSSNFKDKIQEWEEQGLYVFYLPRYSPHLNLIETLWRKIKYEWLKQHKIIGSNDFFAALDYILSKIGTEFNIDFKNQLLPD